MGLCQSSVQSNGKPITETNVTEILNQLKSQYPNGTSFVNGYV